MFAARIGLGKQKQNKNAKKKKYGKHKIKEEKVQYPCQHSEEGWASRQRTIECVGFE